MCEAGDAEDHWFEEHVLPRVDISDVAEIVQIDRLNGLSFELYKETLSFVVVICHMFSDDVAADGWPRNQAICAGLLVRLSKFMLVVVQLSSGEGNRADVVQALNRSILETAINLEFLTKSEEEQVFDEFVTAGLGPERELFDQIQENIQNRQGEILPIERRMLSSILDACRASGVTIEEVQRRHREWGGNLRTRLRSLGKEEWYAGAIRLPSHAVHGNWVDLLKNHLSEIDASGRFRPNTEIGRVDERLLGPIAIFVIYAMLPYISRSFGSTVGMVAMLERLDDLVNRLLAVGRAHEALMNQPAGTS